VLSFRLTEQDKRKKASLLFYFFFLFFVFSDAFFTVQAKQTGIGVMFIPLLFAVSAAVQTLTSYGWGVLIDRIGADKVLMFAYACGVAAQGLLYFQTPLFTWLAFGFLGLFTVASLNANRAFISRYADNRGSVYGVFYAGVALFGAVGAYVTGMLWEHLGMQAALLFSLGGTLFVLLLFVWKQRHG
jgi:MFS family permease